MIAVTSSHFGSAEKEFRFPLGYANQRPLSSHWTVTGSGAFLVQSAEEYRKQNTKSYFSNIRITGVTVGKIVDYGLKDSQNMGACMAPAAMDTIVQNFQEYLYHIANEIGYSDINRKKIRAQLKELINVLEKA